MPRWTRDGGDKSHPYARPSPNTGKAHSGSYDSHTEKWLQQEDGFMLKQKKHGAIIRLKERRQKPIDHLVAISWILDDHKEEHDENDLYAHILLVLKDPVQVMSDLNEQELHEVMEQIDDFNSMEQHQAAKNFWRSSRKFAECQDMFLDPASTNSSVHIVSPEVEEIIGDKTLLELEELETTIQANASDSSMDSDFWSEIHTHLVRKKAGLKLSEFYETAKVKLLTAKKEQIYQKPTDKASMPNNNTLGGSSIIPTFTTKKTRTIYSTTADVYDDTEEETDLQLQPIDLAGSKQGKTPIYSTKVFSGYDWNRYNQVHYSQENPPPKTVKGYQFRLEYPELKDSAKTPSYRVLADPDVPSSEYGPETCILQFRSPSIYKDMAFKIKQGPWDKSPHPNAGYTSKFEDGVLYLSFRFKRQRYKN